MNQRFRITRSMQEDTAAEAITLEECKAYFARRADFAYSQTFSVKGPESIMTIEGDFFMWQYGEAEIPFRLYSGDLYVAVSAEAVVPLMIEIATDLQADIIEG